MRNKLSLGKNWHQDKMYATQNEIYNYENKNEINH